MAEQHPREHFAIARNQAFASFPARSLQLLMDLYRPDTPETVPVVLWLHPGGWHSGSKDHCPVRWLVRYGYAVATVNFRLLPRDHFPAPIHDAKAAVRFLRGHAAQYGLMSNAIAVCGASTGAYLALMVGVTPGHPAYSGLGDAADLASVFGDAVAPPPRAEPEPWDHESDTVNAVVNFHGFTDFMALQGLSSRRDNRGLTSPEARFLGTPPRHNPALADAASPLTYVRPGLPPFVHIHGAKNDVIPITQTRDFHQQLRHTGNTSKMVLLKETGHRYLGILNHQPARFRVVDFLNRHMTGFAAARVFREEPA